MVYEIGVDSKTGQIIHMWIEDGQVDWMNCEPHQHAANTDVNQICPITSGQVDIWAGEYFFLESKVGDAVN